MEQLIRSKDFYLLRFATLEQAAHYLKIPTHRLRQMIRRGEIASDKHEHYISWEQINSYERIRHATHQQPELETKRNVVRTRARPDVRPH